MRLHHRSCTVPYMISYTTPLPTSAIDQRQYITTRRLKCEIMAPTGPTGLILPRRYFPGWQFYPYYAASSFAINIAGAWICYMNTSLLIVCNCNTAVHENDCSNVFLSFFLSFLGQCNLHSNFFFFNVIWFSLIF